MDAIGMAQQRDYADVKLWLCGNAQSHPYQTEVEIQSQSQPTLVRVSANRFGSRGSTTFNARRDGGHQFAYDKELFILNI